MNNPKKLEQMLINLVDIDISASCNNTPYSNGLELNDADLEQSLIELNLALKSEPNNVNILEQKCRILINCSEYTDAKKTIKKAISLEPQNETLNLLLGIVYCDLNEDNKAVNLLSNLKKNKSNTSSICYYLGQSQLKLGLLNDAQESVSLGMSCKHTSGIHIVQGIIHNQRKDFDYAIAEFKKAEKLNPKSVSPLYELYRTYMYKKDYYNSEIVIKKAREIDPEAIESYLCLGKIYFFQERYINSINEFKHVIKNGPIKEEFFCSNLRIHCYLAKCYFEIEEYNSALIETKKAIEIEEYPHFYQCLALVYEKLNDLDNQINSYRNGVELLPNSYMLNQGLGCALGKKGYYKEAIDIFQTALSLAPNNISIDHIKYLIELSKKHQQLEFST